MNIDMLTDTNQLSGEQKELAEIIGIESYKKLIENYGGSHLYIPKSETVMKNLRNSEILKKFNGNNHRKLSREYNISEITVRNILQNFNKKT